MAQSWVIYRQHVRLLKRFPKPCLLQSLTIHSGDFVTNVEVLEKAKVTSIVAMLLKSQLRWTGHVSRMENHRLSRSNRAASCMLAIVTEKHQRNDSDGLKKSFGVFHSKHLYLAFQHQPCCLLL